MELKKNNKKISYYLNLFISLINFFLNLVFSLQIFYFNNIYILIYT